MSLGCKRLQPESRCLGANKFVAAIPRPVLRRGAVRHAARAASSTRASLTGESSVQNWPFEPVNR
jgi:hypothetical protein